VTPALEFIEHNGFIAEVIRTKRTKSASIKVEEGIISVVVPQDLTVERIQQLLNEKKRWIKVKIYLHNQAKPSSEKEFVSGESIPYLGRNYRLLVERGAFTPAKLVAGKLIVTVPTGGNQNVVRNAVVRWYRARALEQFTAKSKRWSKVVGVTPASVGIKAFKSRWGSCSPNGDIQFNWTVMMAPNRIVDYVVAHELCHLVRHDHSPEYWKLVARVMPDFAECKEWLKTNGSALVI